MIKDLRDEVVNIKSAFATIDLDAIKNEITELSATVTGVRADILKPEMFETIPTFVNIKSELTRLNITVSDHGPQIQQLMNGAVAGSSSTPLVGSQADLAATIASAVAVALRKPDGETEGWAGVAGSRLFTQRVKEYRGPMSEFSFGLKLLRAISRSP